MDSMTIDSPKWVSTIIGIVLWPLGWLVSGWVGVLLLHWLVGNDPSESDRFFLGFATLLGPVIFITSLLFAVIKGASWAIGGLLF